MLESRIRPAEPPDADAIATIYNQGIEDRRATFETEQRSGHAFAEWIADVSRPLLVAQAGGAIAGWAGVSRYSQREIYAGVGEYTLYVEREMRGLGLGTRLLEELCATSERSGTYKLVGKLFTDNEASIALARRCGFREVGVHQRHGRLDGAWRDVVLVERLLGTAQTSTK